MSTIYRKYRPQIFANVTGQEHIIQTITNEISSDKIAHAYLFCGPRGTGKTTLARLLAKSINCQNRAKNTFEPCNTCSSCAESMNGNSIDIIEIDAASHTGVDNVRENIIENAQFKPTKSIYKVFIIDEVHMLSTSAFNALLKTLEEPPAHAIFILATTEMHKLPATIISRCQRFNFKKVGYQNMLNRLEYICKKEEVNVEKKVLERIINKSDGCVRDAESLLGQIFSLGAVEKGTITAADAEMVLPTSHIDSILQFITNTAEKQPAKAVELIQKLISDGVNLEQFAYDAIEALRLAMIMQTHANMKNFNTDYNDDDMASLAKIAETTNPITITRMIESLIIRHKEIKSAPIPQLPLELFAIEFGSAAAEISSPTTYNNSPPPVHTAAPKTASTATPPPPTTITTAETKKQSTDEITSTPPEEHHSIAQTIKETISHLTHKPIQTNLEQIKSKWNDVVGIVSKANHSLGFLLKMSTLHTLENNTLTITVPYSFHKDKINEIKTKKTIEQAITDLFSEHVMLACEVDESAAKKDEEENVELNKLAADFGGELM
jgi:DNA polymerase-3 subunit gamma/tau